MKKTTKNQQEPVDKQQYKKKYQLRQHQDKEAQEEIDEYCTNERNPNKVPPLGRKRHEDR